MGLKLFRLVSIDWKKLKYIYKQKFNNCSHFEDTLTFLTFSVKHIIFHFNLLNNLIILKQKNT